VRLASQGTGASVVTLSLAFAAERQYRYPDKPTWFVVAQRVTDS